MTNPNAKKRQQILAVLYQHRKAAAGKPPYEQWTAQAELTDAVDDIDFALWVLVELGHVERNTLDHSVRITGKGVLACEAGQQ